MRRPFASLALLAASLVAAAAPITRWTNEPFDGTGRLVAGGPGNTTLVVLRDGQDPLRSVDAGKTWGAFTVRGARPLDLSISPSDGRTWYAVTAGEGNPELFPRLILRTRDGGETWEERSRMVGYQPEAPAFGPDAEVLYLLRATPTCSGCGGPLKALLTSRDGGRNWSEPLPGAVVLRLFASPADSQVAYVTVFDGSPGSVRATRDGGATWTTVALPLADPTGRVSPLLYFAEIALDRLDANIAYVRPEQVRSAFAGDLYITRDGGETWSRTQQAQGWLVPDPGTPGRVYLRAIGTAADGRFVPESRVLESRDAGRTWVTIDGGTTAAGSAGTLLPDSFVVVLDGGKRMALATLGASNPGKLARLDLSNGALALASDLWWNPAAPGSGLTITQHSSGQVFVVWYTYDAAGKQVWRAMPGGTWNDRLLTGMLYETEGPPFFEGAFDASRVSARPVGSATVDFRDQDNAIVTYAGSHTPITRQLFGDPATYAGENYADLWWNESESGWGIGINHQGNRIFATWYAYGEDGKPVWIVLPDAVIAEEFLGAVPRPVARGDIYITRGSGGQAVATKVGSVRLVFRGLNTAAIEYTAFGRTETRAITRQPF